MSHVVRCGEKPRPPVFTKWTRHCGTMQPSRAKKVSLSLFLSLLLSSLSHSLPLPLSLLLSSLSLTISLSPSLISPFPMNSSIDFEVSALASFPCPQVLGCVFKLVDLYDISLGLLEYQDLLNIQYSVSSSQHKLQASQNIQKIKKVQKSHFVLSHN